MNSKNLPRGVMVYLKVKEMLYVMSGDKTFLEEQIDYIEQLEGLRMVILPFSVNVMGVNEKLEVTDWEEGEGFSLWLQD